MVFGDRFAGEGLAVCSLLTLALRLQLYILAPFFLIAPFAHSELLGLAASIVIILASAIANFITVFIDRMPPSPFDYGPVDEKSPTTRV